MSSDNFSDFTVCIKLKFNYSIIVCDKLDFLNIFRFID